jgi:hypothetical protein
MVDMVWNWPLCKHRIQFVAFLELCTYYRIWIAECAIVAGPVLRILRKNVDCQCETEEKTGMVKLHEALGNAPELKTFDISDGTGDIVIRVDVNVERWAAILQHADKYKEQPQCRIESRL